VLVHGFYKFAAYMTQDSVTAGIVRPIAPIINPKANENSSNTCNMRIQVRSGYGKIIQTDREGSRERDS
jgi:hypothetical protein